MPNDPKWRVIARRARRPIGDVIAIFNHMMINASGANMGGVLRNWNDEVIAASLDNEFFSVAAADVAAVRDAMQGVVLDGDALLGWSVRQPKREDAGSSARSVAYRGRRRAAEAALLLGAAVEANPANPYPNAGETVPADLPPPAIPAEAEIIPPKKARQRVVKNRTRIEPGTQPADADRRAADEAGLSIAEFRAEWAHFRDYHLAKGTLSADWSASWRTWLKNRSAFAPAKRSAETGLEGNFTKAAKTLLGELEDVTTAAGEITGIASTLPDVAFAVADAPVFAGTSRRGDADAFFHLEPGRTDPGATVDAA